MKRLVNSVGLLRTVCMLAIIATAPTLMITTTDAVAQEITATVNGTVLRPDGQPAAGASATITDTRDGRRQSASADGRGIVSFRGLSAGGPYTVRIDGGEFEDVAVTDLYVEIAGTSNFTVSLEEANASIDEITVTASQVSVVNVASGPSSSFNLEQITNLPSSNRQIRDVIRIDPRVSVGRSGDGGDQAGAISCLGGSARTNSFTIDGVRANDAFGLNLSGNLARSTFPIPFDTVEAAAVEFAPVSVEYGQFSGCNVNVVTKSGGNEFHGSGFYLFNSDALTGERIGGDVSNRGDANLGDFDRKNWGAEISGPIIEDKLFFYVSYEETDTASINESGTADSNFANQGTLTTAEVNRIRDILINQYGRDPGDVITNLPVVSERYFARIDWNINDNHRVEGTFSSLEENSQLPDDIGGGRGEFTFSDNFHNRGSDSETFALRLFSNWTDRLSTEVRFSSQEVLDIQDPLAGGEAQNENTPRIAVGPFGNEFFGQNFVSGPGTFRSANQLSTEKDQFKIKADYLLGDHKITAGFEYETVDVFNLFIINATGTVFFSDIDALEAGTARSIRKGVSFTQDPNDAAAAFSRDISTLFLQDEWNITDRLQLVYGLRYDFYGSDDLPLPNPNYTARYGLSNQVSFDDLDAIQPRIGINYTLPERFGDTRVTAGFGVFSGNDPTVWFSNAYQNFGGALGVGTDASPLCPAGTLDVLAGGTFSGIPQCVVDAGQAQALNNSGATNATDPDFDLPTINRFSFGVEHNTNFRNDFFSDWLLKGDLIYSDLQDSVDFLALSLSQSGTAPDGRPIYQTIDPLNAGCNATFNGIRQGFSGVTPECVGGNTDVFLTNRGGDDGYTFTASIQASKLFDWGDAWSLNIGAGYAYNESEVGNPGTTFTANSNFRSAVTSDLANVPVGTSLRNTPHNFTFQATISNDFIADHTTSLTVFAQVRAGNSLTGVYNGGGAAFGDPGNEARNLIYVPTGPNDPLVTYAPGFEIDNFFTWADQNGLQRGAITEKGFLEEDWSTDIDIRIQQEIPFFGDTKVKLFFDIENFGNLINSSFGSKNFFDTTDNASSVGVLDVGIDAATNTYVYSNFRLPEEDADSLDSLYKIQIGIRGEF